MLSLQFIREHPDLVREGIAKKGMEAPLDEILELDKRWRAVQSELESLKAQRNQLQAEIGRQKDPVQRQAAINATRGLSARIRELEPEADALRARLEELLLFVPNLPHASVPVGSDESANVVVRRWGEPRQFDFPPRHHADLGEELGLIDFQRGAKISGTRFSVLCGVGARLARALITFMLDLHTTEHGYREVYPPYLVRASTMVGTGQLPKFAADMYRTEATEEQEALYLIPTAEVPVTNLHAGEILEPGTLPIYYVAYSACFRREAGAAGRETRGLIRVHQFDKVELVKLVEPETSYDELERLVRDAEAVLQRLELPYQVRLLCTGDMSFASAKTYDPEVWMPSLGRYVEVSSCSNFEDFQARRIGLQYRPAVGARARYLHTLNGSGLAVGRTLAAILENYQQADGSVIVPRALRPYMGGLERITRPW
ncbi:MAG TPA: serine--tRNA ligase [Chloroflexota bacterium]|nr:serine--tRNA ligase [Chloroflexota bacterium]